MGFFEGLLNIGLGAAKGVGKVTKGVGKATLGVSEGVGRSFLNSMNSRPVAMIGAATFGALGAYGLAKADNNPNAGHYAGKGALVGTGIGMIGGASVVNSLGMGAVSMAGLAVGGIGETGKAMIKVPTNVNLKLENLSEIKLTNFGKGALIVGGLVDGTRRGVKAFEKSRIGTNDGQFRGPSPYIPQMINNNSSFMNNAGASGDLAFALHNIR